MRANEQRSFDLLPRAITVLVAGHRHDRLADHPGYQGDGGAAFEALDNVLKHCARLCRSSAETDEVFPHSLYRAGSTTIRVLTGQADGVDQHVIGFANVHGLSVDLLVPGTVLPEYRHDQGRTFAFGCPDHLLQSDDAPFAMRDELALSYADVLVAVWDGKPARGRAGGVVRLIQRAVLAGVPVLWIDLQGRSHTVASRRATEECLYRLGRADPEPGLLRSLFEQVASGQGILIESLRQRLNPLDSKRVVQNEESELLARYAAERNGLSLIERRAGSIQELMSGLFRLNRPTILRSVRKMLLGASATAYFGPAGHDPLSDTPKHRASAEPSADPRTKSDGLRDRFAWSDVRANMAGGKHRSSIWLLYTLASVAVLAAVAGVQATHVPGKTIEWAGLVWPFLEVILIIGIVVLVAWSHHKRWHRCWLGHRFMAEQIRYLVMMQPFFAAPATFREPLFVRTDVPHKGRSLASAELWLLQRTLSAEGLPWRYNGYELVNADPAKLAGFLHHVIRHQSLFHKMTQKRAEELHANIHRLAIGLFGLAAFGAAFGAILHFVQDVAPIRLLFLTAFGPSYAAGLHGIATKLEIARIAAQSHRVRSRLVTMAITVSRSLRHLESGDWALTMCLRSDALEVASLLSQENVQWRNLIRHQTTEIPA